MLKNAAFLGFCLLLLGCSGQTEYGSAWRFWLRQDNMLNSPQFNSKTASGLTILALV